MIEPEAGHGQVWFAGVPGDKRRPVLVLSRDPMGRLLHSVICAPITSNIRGLTTEVPLGREAGLAQKSVANFDNTFLLARRRLGNANAATMDAACRALAIAKGCRSLRGFPVAPSPPVPHRSRLRRRVGRAPRRRGAHGRMLTH